MSKELDKKFEDFQYCQGETHSINQPHTGRLFSGGLFMHVATLFRFSGHRYLSGRPGLDWYGFHAGPAELPLGTIFPLEGMVQRKPVYPAATFFSGFHCRGIMGILELLGHRQMDLYSSYPGECKNI